MDMSTTTVKTRFAPSPTGKLHVGNIRIALINWLFTRKQNGVFLLRSDDTDTERSTQEFAEAIQRDLGWLGLNWDETDAQSNRDHRYDWAFETLKKNGRLYPCYETPEELSLKRKIQLNNGKPPVYDRAALSLTQQQIDEYNSKDMEPHWRFKLEHEPIEWQDLGRGAVAFHGANLSDPVLFRANGRPIYTLASVVDDIDHQVTHVLRGEDHVANTAAQIQVCQALGGTPPTYGHLSLLTGKDGEGLSKRFGSFSIEQLREDGYLPMAINSLLAYLGSSEAVQPQKNLAALIADFDISNYGRNTPRFDMDELNRLNALLVHQLPFEAVKNQLPDNADEAFWIGVRDNLEKIDDFKEWHHICYGDVQPAIADEDAEFITMAANLLPTTINMASWQEWTTALKEATGRKGKQLFMPLRLALTGQQHGPELPVLLPLIGREKIVERLNGK